MNLAIADEAVRDETSNQIKKQLTKELKRQNLSYEDEFLVSSTIEEMKLAGPLLIEKDMVYKLGNQAGVPVVITVEALEKEKFLQFTIKAYDIAGEREIVVDQKVSRTPVTRYIMINDSITFVTGKLTGDYGVVTLVKEPKVRKITFFSEHEGMRVFLANGEYLGEIAHSILNVTDREFEIGSELVLIKKLNGYRDGEEVILLEKDKLSVSLSDLVKTQVMALQLNWTYTQLLGVGAGLRYYPVADWMFLSFDNYVYIGKDFTTSNGSETFHNDFRILVGTYLWLGPDSPFRFNLSLGGGVIFTYPFDREGIFYDYYLNMLNISLELNYQDWSFYIRPELKISMGLGDNSLLDGGPILTANYIPPITVGVLKKW
jgi:hypothetical protein